MKRGFFNTTPSQACRTSAGHGPSSTSTSTSMMPVARVTPATSTSGDSDEQPLIQPKHDYTIVEDEDPLILLADHRIQDAPYFGYFPPNKAVPEMVIIDQDLERIEDAAKWEVWKNACFATQGHEDPCCVLKVLEGKGIAMIASRNIRMGELIHKERPILVSIQTYNVAPDQGPKTGDFYRSALSRLGRQQQKQILSLSNCWGRSRDAIPGILATNYLPVDMQEGPHHAGRIYCGCFATLSRANHSCIPNANYFFQFNDFTGRFYANCDIRAGEEITVMYCDLLKSQKIRQETLLKTHRFTCDCEVCGNPNDAGQIQASDSNRLRIKQTIDKLSSSSPKAIELADLQRAIVAADQDGLVTHKAQIFYLGGVLISERELAKPALALSWLREAKRLYAALEGEESHHVAELRICIGS